jgi:hypothetical protein
MRSRGSRSRSARCAGRGALEARGEPQETFLRPDDAEAVLRMALRFAGLEPSKAEGVFKFLDMQAKRNGAADTAGNRDRRRRAQKEKRKK